MIPDIQFFAEDVGFPDFFDAAQTIQGLLECINHLATPVKRMHYVFCSDSYLLEVNRRFLNHDYFTDIITFPQHTAGQAIVSDIFISLDRVSENASTFSAGNIKAELNRVIIHGLLHLCGWADATEKEKVDMRAAEDFYLNLLQ